VYLFGSEIEELQIETDQLKDEYVNHHHPKNMSSHVGRASFINSVSLLNRVQGFKFINSIKAFSRAIGMQATFAESNHVIAFMCILRIPVVAS